MTKLKTLLLAAALGIAVPLGACQSLSIPPAPKSPAQAVFEARATYAGALAIAVQYRNLPSCALPVHPVICSDAALVMKAQAADDIAGPALKAAEAAVRNPDFGKTLLDTTVILAQNAVGAFLSITSSLKVTP